MIELLSNIPIRCIQWDGLDSTLEEIQSSFSRSIKLIDGGKLRFSNFDAEFHQTVNLGDWIAERSSQYYESLSNSQFIEEFPETNRDT